MLFGGLAPFLATLMLETTGLSWSAGLIALFVALLSLIVVLRMRETARTPLAETTALRVLEEPHCSLTEMKALCACISATCSPCSDAMVRHFVVLCTQRDQ